MYVYIHIYSIFKIYLYRMYISCTNGHLGREIKASEQSALSDAAAAGPHVTDVTLQKMRRIRKQSVFFSQWHFVHQKIKI